MFVNIHTEQAFNGLPDEDIHAVLMSVHCPVTYAFWLRLRRKRKVRVGARPVELYAPGYYLYVGSAKRSSGHRVWRHWHGSAKHRWHIDYLRMIAEPSQLYLFHAEEITECDLAQRIQSNTSFQVIPRFGSSDCTCKGHLWLLTGDQLDLSIEARSFLSIS